ncbi:Holliday junction branch migration protein RuvA [Rurimicrobium arvi]|uniref:Holliday junction branch migration complex subunit RuvA n=1 Tax=Rurimicrobium arvi TaxID=2049916 RepID=A0ABP8MR42_9BACT
MFAYLEGKITHKSPSLLFIDVNGVGYEVHITLRTFDQIRHLEQVRLYTHLKVSEDGWTLFGFSDTYEKDTFRQLIGVNGVGAGTARMILSALSPSELERAIVSGQSNVLEKIKGIGAKTAQRIILELKGKLSVPATVAGSDNSAPVHNTNANDALIALMNLGINKSAAETALKKVKDGDQLPVEELVREAFRNL